MPAETPHPPDLLDGWKAIAEYLGKSVRTAQRWKNEFAMPVRRMGERDGENVFAYRSELDAWRRQRGASGAGAEDGANGDSNDGGAEPVVQRRSLPRWVWRAGALCAALCAVAVAAFTLLRIPPQPAFWTVDGRDFVVYDAEKTELWRRTLEHPLPWQAYFNGTSSTRVDPPSGAVPPENVRAFDAAGLADLEGDGRVEAFVLQGTGRRLVTELICLNDTGAVRWTYRPTRVVRFGTDESAAPNVVGVVLRQRPDGSSDLYAPSHTETWFASVLAKLDPASGKPIAEYWSNGHIAMVKFETIAGRDYIVVGAPNNESRGGSLAIFEEARFGGSAPAITEAYRCLSGCPAGAPLHFLVFPRSPMIDAFGGFPSVTGSTTTLTGETILNVNYATVKPAGFPGMLYGDALYSLDARFRVIGAEYSSEYRRLQKYFENAGQMKPEDSVGDEARLWPVLRWNHDRQAFDTIPGPER